MERGCAYFCSCDYKWKQIDYVCKLQCSSIISKDLSSWDDTEHLVIISSITLIIKRGHNTVWGVFQWNECYYNNWEKIIKHHNFGTFILHCLFITHQTVLSKSNACCQRTTFPNPLGEIFWPWWIGQKWDRLGASPQVICKLNVMDIHWCADRAAPQPCEDLTTLKLWICKVLEVWGSASVSYMAGQLKCEWMN